MIGRMRKNSSHQRHHSLASLAVLSMEVTLNFLQFILNIVRLKLLGAVEQVGCVFVSDLGLGRLVHSRHDSRPGGAIFLATPQLPLLSNQGEEISSNAISCFGLQLFFSLPFLKNN